MREINLIQNLVALVDDEDFAELSKYEWSAIRDYGTYYARRY